MKFDPTNFDAMMQQATMGMQMMFGKQTNLECRILRKSILSTSYSLPLSLIYINDTATLKEEYKNTHTQSDAEELAQIWSGKKFPL